MIKKAATFLVLTLLVAALFLSGCNQNAQNQTAKNTTAGGMTSLTAEDVAMILEAEYQQQPAALKGLAESVEQRQKVLDEQFKPLLAVATEARSQGIANEPEIKQQLELAELQTLAFAYDEKNKKDTGKDASAVGAEPFDYIKKEDVDAYLLNAENSVRFDNFIKLLEAKGPSPDQKMPEEQRNMMREQWAKANIAANKAREAGLDKDRKTQLQLEFQKTQVLAREFASRHLKTVEPTKEEIAAYIKEHPEFDTSKKREKAEDLLKRAKAGEDFAKLAKENSEDPGSKDKGGLYENVKKGEFMPEFEAAALKLEKGQIAENLVETPYGYHIIKLENKGTGKDKDGKETQTFSARHILISTTQQDAANPFGQPKSAEQAASDAVKKDKLKKWLDELVAKNNISLPKAEDIKLTVPPMPEMPPMGDPGMMPPAPPSAPEKPATEKEAPAKTEKK